MQVSEQKLILEVDEFGLCRCGDMKKMWLTEMKLTYKMVAVEPVSS